MFTQNLGLRVGYLEGQEDRVGRRMMGRTGVVVCLIGVASRLTKSL